MKIISGLFFGVFVFKRDLDINNFILPLNFFIFDWLFITNSISLETFE